MKKILLSLLVILSIGYCKKQIMAANTEFVWTKTEVFVSYGDDLEKYKNDYKVELYVDGIQSYEFEVFKETNCSSFSTVLTNRLGKYTVYYQAYSQKYNLRSEVPIVFNVVDREEPKVSCENLIYHEYNEVFDVKKHLKISDNHDSIDEIKIEEHFANVNFSQLGIYPAKVIVFDKSGNDVEVSFNIKIIDTFKPAISQIKAVVVNYGDEIKVDDFFVATDNHDGDITDFIKISNYNKNSLGYQKITLSITDESGNITEGDFMILVTDKERPIIELSCYEVELSIENYNEYTESFFMQYIKNIDDNYGIKSIDVNFESLKEEIGIYDVIYVLVDEGDNTTKETLAIKLLESKGPDIIANTDFIFTEGSYVDFYSLVDVRDEYDLNAATRLEIIYNDVNVNQEGSYEITYRCYNSSGKYTVKTFKVQITNGNNINNNLILIVVASIVLMTFGFILTIYLIKKNKNK